jgi:hypothetical protein
VDDRETTTTVISWQECGDCARFHIRLREPIDGERNFEFNCPVLRLTCPKGQGLRSGWCDSDWYNIDNQSSECNHCEQQRRGKLWDLRLGLRVSDRPQGNRLKREHDRPMAWSSRSEQYGTSFPAHSR